MGIHDAMPAPDPRDVRQLAQRIRQAHDATSREREPAPDPRHGRDADRVLIGR